METRAGFLFTSLRGTQCRSNPEKHYRLLRRLQWLAMTYCTWYSRHCEPPQIP
ncbi:MAG: hypothetical protein FWD66_03365 [Paludibacter sp.]|nr:hypothetical protein [Paludibacter sp.]